MFYGKPIGRYLKNAKSYTNLGLQQCLHAK